MMDAEKVLPTRGQLERQMSQTLQSLYRQQFGHLASKITCHLFDNKVAIVAEDTITKVEKILYDHSKLDLVYNIRFAIGEAFVRQVKQITTEILQVEVIDIIFDSTSNSGYLGMIIFLYNSPQMRLSKKSYKQRTTINNKSVDEPTDKADDFITNLSPVK